MCLMKFVWGELKDDNLERLSFGLEGLFVILGIGELCFLQSDDYGWRCGEYLGYLQTACIHNYCIYGTCYQVLCIYQ